MVVMDETAEWTLDELVRRVAVVLSADRGPAGYQGAPNGRVRDLPDQRAVRWYASIGLVDRPAGGRGRGARYGPRQLRQLVAVKLMQAQGLSLAEIQRRLLGIGDDDLARLAPLSPEALAPTGADGAHPGDHLRRGQPSRGARFWASAPAAPAPSSSSGREGEAEASSLHALGALRLAPGVLLVLTVAPRAEDLPALAEAARPLLVALAERGLVPDLPASDPFGSDTRYPAGGAQP